MAGSRDEAITAADGVIDAAEPTGNPFALSFALLAEGIAYRDADPLRALDAYRRGLAIAQDSGTRFSESTLAGNLARLEVEHGEPRAALDHLAWPSATTTTQETSPLSVFPWLSSQPFSTNSDATNRRPP
jgi:hypothetical protein